MRKGYLYAGTVAWLVLALCWTIAIRAESSSAEKDRAEVLAASAAFNKAYAENRLEDYFSYYADNAVLMTPGGTLQAAAEYRAEWKVLLASGGGVAKLVTTQPTAVTISTDGSSAVVAFTPYTAVYKDSEGNESTANYAETDIWWKINGEWKVVYIHYHELDN